MSKILTSPVKRYPGAVTVSDPMSMPQYFAFRDARRAALALNITDDTDTADLQQAMIPGIVACVEKWELQGLPDGITADSFPSSPRVASYNLTAWLWNEIGKIYAAEDEIPNE